jgi:MFS family permease
VSRSALRPLPWPAVLREEPQYRLLFGSQVLSVLGDRLAQVALPFGVLEIGGGVSGIAWVSAAQLLPFIVLSLPAGVWADKRDRRTTLINSDVTRMLCQLAAAALLLFGGASVTWLVIVAAVYGAADAFFAPAFTGLLPARPGGSGLSSSSRRSA